MTSPVLLCADGSHHSTAALAAGVALLDPATPLIVVTVMAEPDPSLVTGSGMAGGVMSPDAFDQLEREAGQDATDVASRTRAELGLDQAEARVLQGDPASAICRLAEELGAAAVVIGSRGHGGIKRAVLGSVSDHVVRNAPCTVIVTGPKGGAED
ncbi:MAG: Universal stress protein UspA-related nucleotide-binding protein [Ilumatobacteraceae bacterium]|nr:Universal stress protein UspA-related nucleotide-binding protein [Ilumatobacteraceae bacterium]